jgi:hypothetical protein
MVAPEAIDDQQPKRILLGYVAKHCWPTPDGPWGRATEVCSVSGCLAGWPQSWQNDPFSDPKLNRADCVNRVDLVLARLTQAERSTHRIYAYAAMPAVFHDSDCTLLAPDQLFEQLDWCGPLPDEPLTSGFERLGLDIVEYRDADHGTWGCSPLSCNYMYQQHPVNAFCLLDRMEDAIAAARQFAQEKPEPGPYLIVEVFRQAASRSDSSAD